MFTFLIECGSMSMDSSALPTVSACPDQVRDRSSANGPAIIVFSHRLRWLSKVRDVVRVMVVGEEPHEPVQDRPSARRKQLSSIEVDPETESDQHRPGTSQDGLPQSRKRFGLRNFKRCLSTRGYAFLVTCIELLGLLYLMTTSVVIFTRDHNWSWFFQPFVAPLWFRHPTALFGTISGFCIAGFVGVVCLMQALDGNKRSPKLILPHLVLQMVTIFATLMFSLISVVLLMTKGTFALRILELGGSTLANGIVGIGNILFGLERGRMATMAAENILLNAGITSAPVLRQEILSNVTSSTAATSVVHYNIIGAIWETFNYEIAMITALLVFGTVCVTEIFAWLLVRQLYVNSLAKQGTDNQSCQNGRSRRRYNSGSTPV